MLTTLTEDWEDEDDAGVPPVLVVSVPPSVGVVPPLCVPPPVIILPESSVLDGPSPPFVGILKTSGLLKAAVGVCCLFILGESGIVNLSRLLNACVDVCCLLISGEVPHPSSILPSALLSIPSPHVSEVVECSVVPVSGAAGRGLQASLPKISAIPQATSVPRFLVFWLQSESSFAGNQEISHEILGI